jgi:hypothetical protein
MMNRILLKKLVSRSAFLLVLLLTPPTGAQPMPAPVSVQWAMLSRVLSFERSLVKMEREIVIGVMYQSKVRESRLAMAEMMKAIQQFPKVEGNVYRCVALEYETSSPTHTGNAVWHETVDALYVTPLRAIDVATIAAQSRKRGTITLTGLPAFVDDGLAVGIDLQGEKPRLLVNLAAATAEGAEFESRLLKLARIVD